MKDNVTLKDVYDAVSELRKEIGDNYVTKAEFTPVKTAVYGVVSLIVTSVVIALVAIVVNK